MEVHLNTGPELTALRETGFYKILRPYLKDRATALGLGADFLVRDEDDPKLTPADRFYFGFEFILSDLFRNVRTRLWIKTELQRMTETDGVDAVGSHFLYRAYLNELVVIQERLQRMIALLKKGLALPVFIQQCEMDVLQFFHPLLFEKRNLNHHGLYLGYARAPEIERLLERGTRAAALQHFRNAMTEEIAWLNYTEQAFAKFLPGFLDRLHQQLRLGERYVEPTRLPVDFHLETRLEGNLRRKHDHAEVYRQANGP
jgi:hypothetical protein